MATRGTLRGVSRVAVRSTLLLIACAAVLVACGGSQQSASPTAEPTLARIAGTPDASTVVTSNLIVLGGTDFATGKTIRIPFQVAQKDGKILHPDGGTAQLYLGATATSPALGPYPVQQLSLKGAGITFELEDEETIMVAAEVPLPAAGAWTAVVTMKVAGKTVVASNQFSILPKEVTPAVGAAAPTARTPTLKDVGGDGTKISTARPLNLTLLRDSIPDLLAAQRPFVVAFATPQFCTSRLCGPVVDITRNIQRALQGTKMAFVHAEIYTDLDPSKGVAPWVLAWALPTEPWIFVVNAQGTITAKFEGSVTPAELEAAARAALAS